MRGGFSVKGALILAEKSAILVDGASMAADSPSIGTEHQNRLNTARAKRGRLLMVGRSFRTRNENLPEFFFEWRDVERQEASVTLT